MPSGTLFINSRRRGKGFRRPAQKHLRFLRQLAKCDGIRVVDHMPQLVVRHGPSRLTVLKCGCCTGGQCHPRTTEPG